MSALIDSINKHDSKRAIALIREGYPMYRDFYTYSPLQHAIINNMEDVALEILRQGCPLYSATDIPHVSELDLACEHDLFPVAVWLIELGMEGDHWCDQLEELVEERIELVTQMERDLIVIGFPKRAAKEICDFECGRVFLGRYLIEKRNVRED